MNLSRRRWPIFEFQRNGPIKRKNASHKPDFSVPAITTKNSKLNEGSPRLTNNNIQSARKQKKVDTYFFIDACNTTELSTIESVEASGKKLNIIEVAVLKQLTSLGKADFSDNLLPLEPFSVLPCLESLDLSCNCIKTFSYASSEKLADGERAWPCLRKLNLSFNYAQDYITELMLIPHIQELDLSHNNLKMLPQNLMHFTSLRCFNLSNNQLQSEQMFFSLATISALQTLYLDDNNVSTIPMCNFGFENLETLSIKKNQISNVSDVEAVFDFLNLKTIYVSGNPVCYRRKFMSELLARCEDTGKDLHYEENSLKPIKKTLPDKIKTIELDPICFPSYTRQHQQAIKNYTNRMKLKKEANGNKTGELQPDDESNISESSDKFFVTDVEKTFRDEPIPTVLPPVKDEEVLITSIWSEIPVLQSDQRKELTTKKRVEFAQAYSRLAFIVEHPDLRIKPRQSILRNESEEVKEDEQPKPQRPMPRRVAKVPSTRRKSTEASRLAARTEYTKLEVQQMLESMSQRLASVEKDLSTADEAGQNAMAAALDYNNFSTLHKQYETIRAELINTLNN